MPASGRLLLDTNIVIALLEGDEPMISNLDEAAEIFIPAIVPGELSSERPSRAGLPRFTAKVERFVAGRSIVSCDLQVAREYVRLRQRPREKGRPLPENDVRIAATAKHHELVLVTRTDTFAKSTIYV
jgi:tRNA(fMet)-specific endonuclease VapC